MSIHWHCDFCTAVVRQTKRPDNWVSAGLQRRSGQMRFTIINLEACDQCFGIIAKTLDRENAIDLLKRMHVVTLAKAEGKRGDT